MRHQRLGRTALQVSELCLGTMNFGPNTTEVDSFELLDHALDNDIDFVDTADRYGGSLGVGATETIIGNWLAQGGDRRERIVLATKLYGPMSDRPNDRGLSARHIRLACDASLRRLQTDHIDLYQMHHIDRTAPWDEVWQAMETLVAQGKISYVGSSNFAGWNIAQANEAAASRHFLGLVSEQSLYNLVERTHRARGDSGVRGVRRRRAPMEPAVRRPARRRALGRRRRSTIVDADARASCGDPTATRSVGGVVQRTR